MLANPVAGVEKMVTTVGKYQTNKNQTEGEPSAAQLIFQVNTPQNKIQQNFF